MHDGRGLPRQVDVRLRKKAELLKIVAEPLRPQPHPDIDENRVAGILQALHERLRPVASHLVATDFPILHHTVAGAGKRVGQLYHALLQAGRRGDDLERRTRLVCIVDATIAPHLVQQFLLFRAVHSFRAFHRGQSERVVQIEFRDVHHRVNLPVLRIHQNHRHPVRLLFLHHFFRGLLAVRLKVVIHANPERVSRHRLDTVFRHALQLDSPRVRDRQDRPVDSLQITLVLDLQADDALVVASREPQHLGTHLVIRVVPFVILIHLHPRQVVIADTVPHLLLHVRLYLLHRGNFFHPLPHGTLVQPQFL